MRRNNYPKELVNTPIYYSWANMKKRCLNKNSPDYFRYGGRGIKVSNDWLDFKNFARDMKSTYKKGLTLDRMDNDGDYCKENCRWTNKLQQANNTRTTIRARKYTFNGETLRISEWARKLGIKRTTLDMRLRHYKWSVNEALS